MSNNEYYEEKLHAFFHDPIDKPLNIYGHENRAADQLKILELDYKKDAVADHITSAADRLPSYLGMDNEPIVVTFDKECEITHPLGGEPLGQQNDDLFLNIDKGYVQEKITDFLTYLKAEYNDDYQRIYLALWRKYPEQIIMTETDKKKLGDIWNFFPADTRIPDHTIMSHNFLTAAVHSCGDNVSFIKFALGPVQSFISTAKRTEDFWMSSYLLSYLISKGIITIIEELGVDHIIFPSVKGQPLIDRYLNERYNLNVKYDKYKLKLSSLSNVIFFICPAEKSDVIIKKIEDSIQKEWTNISNSVKDRFEFSGYSEDIFDKQISSFLEFYSAVVKINQKELEEFKNFYIESIGEFSIRESRYKDNIGTYWSKIYDYLDKLFISNKLIRKQNNIVETGWKCSLCGEHSAIASDENISNNSNELKDYWKELSAKTDSHRLDKTGTDRLCAVCLTKRMAQELYFRDLYDINSGFPSVATVATWTFKEHVIDIWNEEIKNSFIEFYEKVKKLDDSRSEYPYYLKKKLKEKQLYENDEIDSFMKLDGQWFFKEMIEEYIKKLKKGQKDLKDIDVSSFTKSLGRFLDSIKKQNKEIKPIKYYVILRMDGDSMGKWLSGTYPNHPLYSEVVHSKLKNDLNDRDILEQKRDVAPAMHSFISKTLNYYSLNIVKRIVEEEYPGKLIYSGGDDVLALLPFESAIECAERLRFEFSGHIHDDKIDLNSEYGYYIGRTDKKEKKIIPTLGKNASMSAGLVYSHIKYNFQAAIEKSHDCEVAAKEDYGRNSFFISILKHSGNEIDFGLKWYDENKNRAVEKIKNILKHFYEGDISTNFFSSAYDMLSLIDDRNMFQALLEKEVKDHIDRKADKKKEKIQDIIDSFAKLREMIGTDNQNKKLLSIFKALRFFASKGGKE